MLLVLPMLVVADNMISQRCRFGTWREGGKRDALRATTLVDNGPLSGTSMQRLA